MTMIQLIACIGMIVGLFMVLHVSPRELSDSLFARLTAAPGSIRADINETTRRKKAGFLRREITEAQAVLAASGRTDKFPLVCFTSMLCFALGACIAIAAGNAFLVPVLAVGLMLTPFWYVKLTAGSFKKDVAAELETALSVITTAYLRTENFQQAVEENVRYLHPPVQEVFQHFLMRMELTACQTSVPIRCTTAPRSPVPSIPCRTFPVLPFGMTGTSAFTLAAVRSLKLWVPSTVLSKQNWLTEVGRTG